MSYSRKEYSTYSLYVGSCIIVSLIIIVATLMHYNVGPFLIYCCAQEACTLTNARRYLNLSSESEIFCSTFFRLSHRSHTTTWPLLQPPASRFSLYGQNCSAWTLRGLFSINCKSRNGMIIVFQSTMTIWNHVQLHFYDISDSDDSRYSDYYLLGWLLVCISVDSTNILEKPADSIFRAQHRGSSFLYLSTELCAITNEQTRIRNNFHIWGGADKSLARPGRKQATGTELRIYSTHSHTS